LTSRVLLITDAKSAIPVIDVRNGLRSVAVGVGDSSSIELAYVPETSDVKEGDLLVTSNLGLRLPEGYPVGIVHSVRHILGERFAKVVVIPSAKVESSRYVLMIWPGQPKIEKTQTKDIKSSGKNSAVKSKSRSGAK
jgi:rod shape-determining protein MreC